MNTEEITEALNNLIKHCANNGGHVFIVDKRQNNFVIRLTEEIKVSAFIPSGMEVDK